VVAIAATPVVRDAYHIGVPQAGVYREILNTDSHFYGGGNVGNGGSVETVPIAAHGFAQSLKLTLPPLGALYLSFESGVSLSSPFDRLRVTRPGRPSSFDTGPSGPARDDRLGASAQDDKA
jgi:Alpha amylase, C-terminal all-beta domain